MAMEPPCTSELFTSDKAKALTVHELIANVVCALQDIATSIREFLSYASRKRLTNYTIVGDKVTVGEPFIPIGHIGGPLYPIALDEDTWELTLSDSYNSGTMDSDQFKVILL